MLEIILCNLLMQCLPVAATATLPAPDAVIVPATPPAAADAVTAVAAPAQVETPVATPPADKPAEALDNTTGVAAPAVATIVTAAAVRTTILISLNLLNRN